MTILTKTMAGIFIAGTFISTNDFHFKGKKNFPVTFIITQPRIQVAILLDVSNSMDGLIDQAKAQLWNMVGVMGNAKCDEGIPFIEIALYEYGRSTNSGKKGFVKQLSPFSTDLDQLSQKLFSLKTNGGEEYCGHVIYSSINELNWDTASTNYKVIFIAGNEDFLQGDVTYTKACAAAREKGVIVNTIYCGDRMNGIREHWDLGGECGNGSFTNINKDAKPDDIETPYDSALFSLNEKLNGTYINYGLYGARGFSAQVAADSLNYSFNKSAAVKRIGVKGKKELYKNSSWDLVDASFGHDGLIDEINMKTLPDSLQRKSREELKQVVKIKNAERDNIRKEIAETNSKREMYLAAEKKKNAAAGDAATLETEIEKLIRQQAKRFNMQVQ